MYGFEILRQCGKSVKIKSQKVFGDNFYVCTRYRGKLDRVEILKNSRYN